MCFYHNTSARVQINLKSSADKWQTKIPPRSASSVSPLRSSSLRALPRLWKAEDVLRLLGVDEFKTPRAAPKAHTTRKTEEKPDISRLEAMADFSWDREYGKFVGGGGGTPEEIDLFNTPAGSRLGKVSGRTQSLEGTSSWLSRGPSSKTKQTSSSGRRGAGSADENDHVVRRGRVRPESPGRKKLFGQEDPNDELNKTRVSPMFVLIVLLGILLVAAYAISLQRSYRRAQERAVLVDVFGEANRFCKSPGCFQALELTRSWANPSVMPCHDIYTFACGNWNATTRWFSTYLRLLEARFHNRVDRGLLEPDAVFRGIRKVFGSCLAFYTDQVTPLESMWEVAKMDAQRWLLVKNHSQLFDMVVESMLTNHLESFLKLILHRNGTVDVFIGYGIEPESYFNLRHALMHQTSRLPGSDRLRLLEAELKQLNEKIIRLEEQYEGILNPLVSVGKGQFDEDPVVRPFAGSLLRHTSSASIPPITTVRHPDDSSVAQMVQTFQAADLKVAAFYSLYAPFADYINYEKKTSFIRGRLENVTVQRTCVNYLHLLFKDALHSVIFKATDSSNAHAYVNAMWKQLQVIGEKRPDAGGLRLKEDPVSPNLTVPIHGLPGRNDTVPVGALEAPYGEYFVLNLILYARETGVQVPVEPDNSWVNDTVEPKFLQPPFYHSDATEPFVNYATLGVLVAQRLFELSLPENISKDVGVCFATHSKAEMNFTFTPQEWKKYAGLVWALETALEAALGASNRSFTQECFMFLRYAQTYCGLGMTERRMLFYAVRASDSFARTFGCAPSAYPNCKETPHVEFKRTL